MSERAKNEVTCHGHNQFWHAEYRFAFQPEAFRDLVLVRRELERRDKVIVLVVDVPADAVVFEDRHQVVFPADKFDVVASFDADTELEKVESFCFAAT